MPNKDGTGPERKGPKTGRGLGPCNTQKEVRGPANQGRSLGPNRRRNHPPR